MGLGSRKPSGLADKLCINRPDTGPYLTQELCHAHLQNAMRITFTKVEKRNRGVSKNQSYAMLARSFYYRVKFCSCTKQVSQLTYKDMLLVC